MARTSWIDGCAFASYAAIKALETARNVSAQCGEMTVEVEGQIAQCRVGHVIPTAPRGARKASTCSGRPLIMPHEITQSDAQGRADHHRTGPRARSAAGRAIYFRRKDMDAQASPNRFVKSAV
jgi:type IV secretion system protein VirD4